jgi:hypothetical protein
LHAYFCPRHASKAFRFCYSFRTATLHVPVNEVVTFRRRSKSGNVGVRHRFRCLLGDNDAERLP